MPYARVALPVSILVALVSAAWGGEPTLNPHWHEVGRRLGDHGVAVNLVSNGWAFGEGELEKARSAGLRSVAFSLDGLEEAHDEIRAAGSFRRAVEAVDRCVDARVPVSVGSVELTVVSVERRKAVVEVPTCARLLLIVALHRCQE